MTTPFRAPTYPPPQVPLPHSHFTLYLDIETTRFFDDPELVPLPRWRQLAAMPFGVAVTYAPMAGMRTWWPDDIQALWMSQAGYTVCTWNGDEFDHPLLLAQLLASGVNADTLYGVPFRSMDLCVLVQRETRRQGGRARWYSLDAISEANLGQKKSGNGRDAAEWLANGDPTLRQRAVDYCADDVRLVMALYERLLRGEGLRCPPRPERGEEGELLVQLPEEFRAQLTEAVQ